MPEPELIDHAGLDSAVYLPHLLDGIFVPITFLAWAILVPVNYTNNALEAAKMVADVTASDIDKLSISNIPLKITKILDAYSDGLCLYFLDVLRVAKGKDVVQINSQSLLGMYLQIQMKLSVSLWNTFFLVNHPDHYLTHRVVCNANKLASLVKKKKKKQNWLDYYQLKYSRDQSQRPQMKTGFLGLWGEKWMQSIITYQRLRNCQKKFLPGIALKLFLIFLPTILMIMSKFEGFVSLSSLERRSATRYYIFLIINVFLGSILTGAAFEQLNSFINQSANEIPKTIGVAVPMKATFFITYIMVDGWAGIAGEVLMLKPLILYHLKNFFLVKTEKDREEAMDPGSVGFNTGEPRIQLYFLLGLVYATVTPLLLPFIIIFFAFAFAVFRHQIINVYNQEYESGAAFWPDVHGRVITALVISQLSLMGLMSTKQAAQSTPFLIALPVLTIWFHRFCNGRHKSAFVKYPLQV
ncbi:calcium permeable stress-gated cation channel 1-like [Populus alba x Populus x berolinensis]|nr:calcium permeable stress-gated cation channel 1-like [Populus alba x Populus x berolinensis]